MCRFNETRCKKSQPEVVEAMAPRSGLAIYSFCQGIVGMVLRAGAMGSSFIALIGATVTLGMYVDLLDGDSPADDLSRGIIGSCAFVVIITALGLLTGGFILARFLNIGLVNSMVIGGVLATGHFAGGVATAYYADDDHLRHLAPVARVRYGLAATAASCFISLLLYVMLITRNILSLAINWNGAVKGEVRDDVKTYYVEQQ